MAKFHAPGDCQPITAAIASIAMTLAPDDAALRFTGHRLDAPDRPLLIAVPHAGRDYPAALLARARVPGGVLQRLEDRYADLLARRAVEQGFSCIVAHRPRAWIDLNRSPREVDAAMIDGLAEDAADPPGIKVRGGLGLIPRWLGSDGELWRSRLTAAELADRIASDHTPYHDRIARTLQTMRQRFGGAVLLDLHSMPPLRGMAGPRKQIVVGDRFGRSASARFGSLIVDGAESAGLGAALNHPYAGGYALQRHGAPMDDIQALQIEIDRGLYLDPALREPEPAGLERMARWVLHAANLLEQEIAAPRWALAAE